MYTVFSCVCSLKEKKDSFFFKLKFDIIKNVYSIFLRQRIKVIKKKINNKLI